jgi:hypothetical protein
MRISYRGFIQDRNVTAGIYIVVESSRPSRVINYQVPIPDGSLQNHAITIDPVQCTDRLGGDENTQITKIGAYVSSRNGEHRQERNALVLEVLSLSILPRDMAIPCVQINNIRIEDRLEGKSEHHRLCWQLLERDNDESGEWQSVSTMTERLMGSSKHGYQISGRRYDGVLPRSSLTGSVSHFLVSIAALGYQERVTVSVHGTEMLLPEPLIEEWQTGVLQVQINAVQFGGNMVRSKMVELRGEESTADWEFVPQNS